jgi:cell fate regulator YaaT (PSP1 superfamily)
MEVETDQYVIVETARGIECGRVSVTAHEVDENEIVKPLKKMLRSASKKDIQQAEENHRREERAFEICQQKIAARKMEMKLVDVEYAFDGSKILFYFTADGRVDFRELVKDLASVFRTRIELRQIGVRDEARMIGGLGICGREFCCSSFLSDFQPVSIRMAKEQGLSLNPTKISGTCGRLMCCLKYEQEAYEDLIRTTPKQNSVVTTPDGRGVVTEVSLLTGMLKVRLDGENGEVRVYHKEDLVGAPRGCGGCCRERRTQEQQAAAEAAAPVQEEPREPVGDRAPQPRQQQRRAPQPKGGETRQNRPERRNDTAGDGQQNRQERRTDTAGDGQQNRPERRTDAAGEQAQRPRRRHRRGGVHHRPKNPNGAPAQGAAKPSGE